MKQLSTSVRASEGIAIGRAYVIARKTFADTIGNTASIEAETERLDKALSESIEQINELSKHDDIFAAHLEMISDDMLRDSITTHISTGESALTAVKAAETEMTAMFEAIDDEYLRARTADIHDIFSRIAANLTGGVHNPFEHVKEGDIIIADSLSPSDMAMIDFKRVRGFITKDGSSTSHVCIIARNRAIPAIVGLQEIDTIKMGDSLILDASSGTVIVNADETTTEYYLKAIADYSALRQRENESSNAKLLDRDGKSIEVCANVGNIDEIHRAIESGADGIGLFRSEFLYMQSDCEPTEQQQYEAYKEAADICGDKPLTIRTLDIGGDKSLSYMNFDHEDNPFLGWRAIRISLAVPEMFRTQLRAILRASTKGNIRIMFPMIVDIDELRQAKSILEECKCELRKSGIQFDNDIRIGVMIETPAAVFVAKTLAKECDFFSIGTNDLTQYIMASDRANTKVSYLYNPYSEAVMSAIGSTIRIAEEAGIECGMCGELASDVSAVSKLLSMGLHEFSVNISSIGRIKSRIAETITTVTE